MLLRQQEQGDMAEDTRVRPLTRNDGKSKTKGRGRRGSMAENAHGG